MNPPFNIKNLLPESFFNKGLSEVYFTTKALQYNLAESFKALSKATEPFKTISVHSQAIRLNKVAEEFQTFFNRLKENPEYQFGIITELPLLSLETGREFVEGDLSEDDLESLVSREEVVTENLDLLFNELNPELKKLWIGANYAYRSSLEVNPDKVRHCMTSLRTLMEYIIENMLAPDDKVKVWTDFEKHFEEHCKKQNITDSMHKRQIKISRSIRIKYFCSKIDFAFLEDFTQKDIKFVNDCYYELSKLHNPEINISNLQLRALKLKSEITIWLLLYIYRIIKE